MEKLLPSRKFIVAVGSLFAVFVMGWLFITAWNDFAQKRQTYAALNTSIATINASEEANKDSDGDGLKDWEEILWKTDIHNPDTDKDGTSDGEEVKNGRDPMVPNTAPIGKIPNDKLKTPEEMKSADNPNQKANLTTRISQEFADQYFANKGMANGGQLAVNAQKNIANALALNFEKNTASYADVFTKEDIKISNTLDEKSYLNDLGYALEKNFRGADSSELSIVASAVSSKDFSKINNLKTILTAYKNTVNFLKNQSVPAGFADLHITLLNSMQNTLFAVRNMQQIENDPAKGMVGVKLYLKEVERAKIYLSSLKDKIRSDKITFAENDGGAFFNRYLSKI